MVSIFLERTVPAKLFALERVVRRLHHNHPQFDVVKQALYNTQSGHGGEQYIDSALASLHFPIPHFIFPNFRLKTNFIPSTQIDILLLTSAYALVIEVKNWSGTITFQNTGQAIQEKNDIVRSMDCPIVQAENYKENLLEWFLMNDIPLPVHRIVIFPYASTLLIGAENRDVHFSKELPQIIRKLNKLPTQLQMHQFEALSIKLQAANQPFANENICQHYGIHPTELMAGLYCSNCHNQLFKKNSRYYTCSKCPIILDNPIQEAMIDWFTLFGNHVTNKNIRTLTGIEDSYKVQYLMKKTNFPSSGLNKGTVYHVNEEEKIKYLRKKQIGDKLRI